MTSAIIVRGMVAGYSKGDIITDADKMADMEKRPDQFWHKIELPDDHEIFPAKSGTAPVAAAHKALPMPMEDAVKPLV